MSKLLGKNETKIIDKKNPQVINTKLRWKSIGNPISWAMSDTDRENIIPNTTGEIVLNGKTASVIFTI